MIRVLLMIAAAGFVLAVGSFAAAFAIGGPEIVSRGGWMLFSDNDFHDWRKDRHWHERGEGRHDRGPRATRELAWTGGESLSIDLPANVEFIQTDGPGGVTVTGRDSQVGDVVLEDGHLRFKTSGERWHSRKLRVVIRAPKITRFDLSGVTSLKIEDYRQDQLTLKVSGAAEVTAEGSAKTVDVAISGSGDVDLGDLVTEGAKVEVSGVGDATVAPTEWAKLAISGMGDVRLKTRPKTLDTDVSGAGRVRQPGQDDDDRSEAKT